MGLDLELVGAVREVQVGEEPPRASTPTTLRLRDSHHALARLLSRGVDETTCSHMTGYALSRISALKRDPLFIELMTAYRIDARDVQRDLEAMWLGIAQDYAQHAHERLHDSPDEVSVQTALDAFKVFADRAGFSPIARSDNRNVNINIGDRLDRARARYNPPNPSNPTQAGASPTVITQSPQSPQDTTNGTQPSTSTSSLTHSTVHQGVTRPATPGRMRPLPDED